jgi:undecaprenyl-diphosphatase
VKKHPPHRDARKTANATGRGGRKRTLPGLFRSLDHILVRRWQRIRLHACLEGVLKAFVRMGDGWGWLVVTLALALLYPRERFLFLAGQGVLAAVFSVPLYWVLKATFRRTRPHALFKRIVPRVAPRDVYSFPSGHTMNNLAIGVALAVHIPWLWPFALAIPLATGLLRVLFGVHFVTDIAAGALLGMAAGLAAAAVYPSLPMW